MSALTLPAFAAPLTLLPTRITSHYLRQLITTRTLHHPQKPPHQQRCHYKHTQTLQSKVTTPKSDLVGKASRLGVEPNIAEKVVRAAERACQEWTTVTTDFLKPPEWQVLVKVLKNLAGARVSTWGGFTQAERRVIVISREEVGGEDEEDGVEGGGEVGNEFLAALFIKGNFLFETNISHRDFLGTLMSLGITREKVGDILMLGDRGAQVVVKKEIVDVVRSDVSQVRRVGVVVEEIGFEDLDVREPVKKELTTVEASMRLDAVSSAGFGMSRNKLSALIKSGNVQVNYREVTCPGKTLRTSDLVSLRGKGRLEIGQVATTAKGRFRINISRFV